MKSSWPEFDRLIGTEIAGTRHTWIIREAHIVEDQRSSRLALVLVLKSANDSWRIRLLFPGETHAVEHNHRTDWIVDSIRGIIESDRLHDQGIYSIG